MIVKGYRVGTLFKQVGREVWDDSVPGLAAETAYYFFFSLFPLLLFLTPLFGLIADREEFVGFLVGQFQGTIPPAAVETLTGVVDDVVFSESAPGLISLGALLALWAGSNVFNGITGALNRAYDVEEGRAWWKTRLLSLGMVFVSGLVIGTATLTFVIGDTVIAWLGELLGMSPAATAFWTVAQFTLALVFLCGLAWLQYYVLPATRQDRRHVLVGAVFCTVTWLLVTLLFRLYVTNFGDYNRTYGSIGGVIVLLIWMYLSMLVLLVGGELNSELHKGTGRVTARSGTLYAQRISTGELPETSVDRIGKPRTAGSDAAAAAFSERE